MKKYIIIGGLLSLLVTVVSCKKTEEVPDPVASFELYWQYVDLQNSKLVNDTVKYIPGTDTLVVRRNEQLVFKNTSKGTHFSIWTGDTGANYGILNNSGSNFPLSSTGVDFFKIYSTRGNYKLWVIAKSASKDGQIVKSSTITANIKVI
ncbi:hypothetical protein [Pedobacter glucosidilyticus]|uniref:hypothetical protein n=1 Tax=Pedobacter glucosidilyticus TaxID=1122941 RepID=UPI00041215F8|nr:hypothetical protein [Pedobacter glucosidilyticus]